MSNIILSEDYVANKFKLYVGYPDPNKHNNTYRGGCPICHEGTSWGKKKRCMYLPSRNQIFCHNCQKSWNPINWIMEVSGISFKEIMQESNQVMAYDKNLAVKLNRIIHENKQTPIIQNEEILPKDSINLCDPIQVKYYENKQVITDCLRYLNDRLLFSAVNRPKNYYISLSDDVHKNRLILPYYDENNKIIFYQSRAIYKKDENPKYLSKSNSTFSIFGVNNISNELSNLFLFEGPIDSCFVRNGLGIGGITLSDYKKEQLKKYHLFNKIWVLDNQFDNENVVKKYSEIIQKGGRIFFTPDKLKQFKDLNEICVKYKISKVDPSFIINNSFTGLQAELKLKEALSRK